MQIRVFIFKLFVYFLSFHYLFSIIKRKQNIPIPADLNAYFNNSSNILRQTCIIIGIFTQDLFAQMYFQSKQIQSIQ